MSKFEDGNYSTPASKALIGKIMAGRCKMKYTRAAVGKGAIPDGMTPNTMSGPADYVMDAQIVAVSNPVDGECQVLVQIHSKDVDRGFDCTNLVLFADDPDDGDVPFTYLVLENDPERIRPSSSSVGGVYNIYLISAVDEVDAVEGAIPADAMATLRQVAEMLEEHNQDPEAHPNLHPGAGSEGGVVAQTSLTVPAEGWEASGSDAFPWKRLVECELSKPDLVPCVILDPASMLAANDAGLCPSVTTMDGSLLFLSKRVPERDLTGSLILYEDGTQAEQMDVTILTDGWANVSEEDAGISDAYHLRCDLPLDGVEESMTPILAVLPDYQAEAVACGLCPTCRTMEHTLRLYTRIAPSKELKASLTLLKAPKD